MPALLRHAFPALPAKMHIAGKVLLAAVLFLGSMAADGDIQREPELDAAPLFADDSVLAVTIEAPLTTLMRDRPDEVYLAGKFSFTNREGIEQTFDLKVRTRGKYRREEEHCKFAPIRLNFRKSQVAGTIFEGQDKLKLVTHCQNYKPEFEQLILREYLAYRFLNVVTDRSFRVRLMRVRYVDTEGSRALTRWGFVIEDDDAVAQRNGMQTVKTGNLSSDELDRKQQNLVHVFQYLIGNTEYSLFAAEPDEYCCHNIDLMSAHDDGAVYPLAYDFDFAGLVNAPYAQPNPRYKIQSVRQRLFKGRCRNIELLPATFQRFSDRRDAIYAVVEDLEALTPNSRRYVNRYLNGFFHHISKPQDVQARFIDKCSYLPVTTSGAAGPR